MAAAKAQNVALLERIKQLAIISVFSDEDLMNSLVLKGGNALDLIYKISPRSSVDVDFSMGADFPGGPDAFRECIKAALSTTFLEAGFHAFDFKVEEQPDRLPKNDELKEFWGGYYIEFKLIEAGKFKQYENSIDSLRKYAIDLGKGPKFLIDVSRHEHIESRVERELDGYLIFVYSPEMILAEKLRALCQQMPDYGPIVKRDRPGSARAKDFVDIYWIVQECGVDMTTPENIELISSVFAAKRVPLEFLGRLHEYKSFHESNFPGVRDSWKVGQELQGFDVYFSFVLDLIAKLKALWNV